MCWILTELLKEHPSSRSVHVLSGVQRGECAKCSFFFIMSFYVCLLPCASRRICFVEHTDPLYVLNTYVIIPTSAVGCSRRNVFATDQYTGIQSQSKPSSRHQLQGASAYTSHGRTPITPFKMFTNLPGTYLNVLHYLTFSGLLLFGLSQKCSHSTQSIQRFSYVDMCWMDNWRSAFVLNEQAFKFRLKPSSQFRSPLRSKKRNRVSTSVRLWHIEPLAVFSWYSV